MGKKSKRNRSKKDSTTTTTTTTTDDNVDDPPQQPPPPLRPTKPKKEEETISNLQFEDPFEDVYEDEEIVSNNDDDDDIQNIQNDDPNELTEQIQSWTPWGTSSSSSSKEKLEMDPSAYKMYHSLTPEWPCLSFDFLKDTYGEHRTRFPHSFLAVIGSQADRDDRNKLTVMKLSDLGRMEKETTVEEEEEEESGDEEESDKEEVEESEPILEYYSMKHDNGGAINRVRSMKGCSNVVAAWGEKGTVSLFDVQGIIDKFDHKGKLSEKKKHHSSSGAFFTYGKHHGEGFGLDWSSVQTGHLATGDCHGNIHLWTPVESLGGDNNGGGGGNWDQSSFSVDEYYTSHYSVEDLQWSPTEGTVIAAAECNGRVKIYDSRCKGKPMLTCLVHENHSDVNVISWNHNVSNLLATGSDDGVFSVYDLRNFSTNTQPLARFTPHQKPITSLEWHSTDESMIVVSDEDATYIYDLSIEADDDDDEKGMDQTKQKQDHKVPPQMLFMDCGSTSTKEVHWHPQVTSMVMTTALSGFSVFIPSNL